MYNRKDYYYKKAKDEGRASRASFKLEQIQSRYHIIKRGDVVLDLGAAPGSWMEVVSEIVGDKGFVVGVDLLPLKVKLKTNMQFFQGDLNQTEEILSHLHQTEEVDVILSDMAPNTSGVAFKDAYLSYELCLKA
ncbi:MAG: RlmE family RNA methyltransferase, partial [Deltaproteobacteria bacterium]|nr:RlmE family RNA methyltransferase [Deltaproteobacteria bacterium]